MPTRPCFGVCSTLVSSYYATAFALLGLYGVVTLALPRFGATIRFVSRFPRAAIALWLAGLAVSIASLMTAFGMLIANSLSDSATLGIGESWQAAVAQYALGWISLAGVGVIVFHLGAAAQWLQSARRDEIRRISGALGQSTTSALGDDVREIDIPGVRVLSAVPQANVVAVSADARRAVTDEQFAAILAHEREHLRANHATVLFIAQLAMAAAAGVQASQRFERTVNLAIEFAADDRAVAETSAAALAGALTALSALQDPLTQVRLNRLAR